MCAFKGDGQPADKPVDQEDLKGGREGGREGGEKGGGFMRLMLRRARENDKEGRARREAGKEGRR